MLSLIITLAVIGLICWALTTYIPMSPGIRKIIIVVVLCCALLYVLQAFGLLGRLDMPVPQVR